jgi:hypothetical protein
MANGTGKEIDLTKIDTISGNDYVRVLKDGASRNITLTNFIAVLNPLLNSTSSVVTSTTNYLATASNDVILMDLTAGALAVTLPAGSANEGVLIQVKKIDGTTNDLTVQTAGGNIDGSATATLSGSGGAKPGASFICDGANWFILNA